MPGLEVEAAGMFNLPHVCVLLVGFPPLVRVLPLDLVDVVVVTTCQFRHLFEGQRHQPLQRQSRPVRGS